MATQDERAARREGVERDLRRYEERSRYLDQRVEAAKAALQKAQEELALATTRAKYARIDCDLIRRQLAFDPDVFNGLPCELLQAIFVQAFDNTDRKDIGRLSYSRERSLVPYRLGAVCRHWRRVVHDTPELWTYIATPPWNSRHHRHFADYVERHLSLSRSRPLQLCLDHMNQDKGGADAQWFAETVVTLSPHVQRCRTLKLVYPHDVQDRVFELLTENPPLLLEEVILGRATPMPAGYFEAPVDAPWLSGAPLLRRIHTERIALRLTSALSSIQSANFWVVGLDALASTLHQLPRLQHLTLYFTRAPSVVPQAVDLPTLHSLTVSTRDPYAERVVACFVAAPQLQKLRVELPEYDRDGPFGRRYVDAFPDLTDLELLGNGALSATHALTFGRLNRLQRVVFDRCAFPQYVPKKGDAGSFWRGAVAGPVWPELESLTISSYASNDYTDKSHVLDEIRDFVLTRCSAASNGPGKRFILSLTCWPVSTFPQKLVRELVRALGPENFRLQNESGLVQSVSAVDGG